MSDLVEIFMIDDHPIYIDGMKEAFLRSQSKYFIIDTAKSIAEARVKIEKTRANIVLLDLKLPDESGVDYCAELKNKFPDKKVIALTGETDNTTLFNTWMNMADAIVMKYSGINDLTEVIKSVQKGNRIIGKGVPLALDHVNSRKDPNQPYLTKKEQQVLLLLMSGLSRQEVAEKLFVGSETINTHCKRMFAKFNVKNLTSLIQIVKQNRILE